MRERYRIAARSSTPGNREPADWLAKDGQLLIPLVELLKKGERAIDEVTDVMGRATVEPVLRMSAERVAGPKEQGRHDADREVNWPRGAGGARGVEGAAARRPVAGPDRHNLVSQPTTMKPITRFRIQKLHGFRNIDIPIDDNTLILVGENGSGKTTILRLLYCLLTGQWSSMAVYDFHSIHLDIDTHSYQLTRTDITKHLTRGDSRSYLHRLPPSARHRFLSLLEQSEPVALSQLERLCVRYDLPFSEVIRDP